MSVEDEPESQSLCAKCCCLFVVTPVGNFVGATSSIMRSAFFQPLLNGRETITGPLLFIFGDAIVLLCHRNGKQRDFKMHSSKNKSIFRKSFESYPSLGLKIILVMRAYYRVSRYLLGIHKN